MGLSTRIRDIYKRIVNRVLDPAGEKKMNAITMTVPGGHAPIYENKVFVLLLFVPFVQRSSHYILYVVVGKLLLSISSL